MAELKDNDLVTVKDNRETGMVFRVHSIQDTPNGKVAMLRRVAVVNGNGYAIGKPAETTNIIGYPPAWLTRVVACYVEVE